MTRFTGTKIFMLRNPCLNFSGLREGKLQLLFMPDNLTTVDVNVNLKYPCNIAEIQKARKRINIHRLRRAPHWHYSSGYIHNKKAKGIAVERESMEFDVVIVGAGPAGLVSRHSTDAASQSSRALNSVFVWWKKAQKWARTSYPALCLKPGP